jgi:hypothetical protein
MNRTGQHSGKHHPLWLWPNLLGLDSPAVAVAWQWIFTRVFSIELPWVFHLILGLSVWCIYLADRLYDAFRAPDTDSGTDRLDFTRKHFTSLSAVTVMAGLVNLFLIIRHVPRHLMISGLITTALLGIYYLIRMKSSARIAAVIPREFLCGMLFGLGTVIAPHAFVPPGTSELRFYLPMVFFGLACSASCVLISIWEREADIASSDQSAATLQSRIIPHMATAITALAMISTALVFFGPWQIYLSVAFSAVALRLMLRFDDRIPPAALRALADGVLLTPLLFVFL